MAQYTKQQSNKSQQPLEEPNQWINMVQDMFKQCVKCISWMHNQGVVHLDLSLENTMLIAPKEGSNVPLCKIIDFGLAKQFNINNHESYYFNERVGKTGYMSPEVYNKQKYDGRLADIWSLGVMLFMMLIGAPPYEIPTKQNPAFNFIIQGRLKDVLIHWKRIRLVTKDALDLMIQIFKPESERINMKQLLKHPFVGLTLIEEEEEKNNQPLQQQQQQPQPQEEEDMKQDEITPSIQQEGKQQIKEESHEINKEEEDNKQKEIVVEVEVKSIVVSEKEKELNLNQKQQEEEITIITLSQEEEAKQIRKQQQEEQQQQQQQIEGQGVQGEGIQSMSSGHEPNSNSQHSQPSQSSSQISQVSQSHILPNEPLNPIQIIANKLVCNLCCCKQMKEKE